MSLTTAAGSSASSERSSGGAPCMPRLVVLTRSAAPASARFPIEHTDIVAERRGEAFRPRAMAVEETKFANAGIKERPHHGARGAARAQHHRRSLVAAPVWRARAQILDEAEAVGIAPLEAPVAADDDRVHRS